MKSSSVESVDERAIETGEELEPGISLIRGGPFYQAQLKSRLIFPRKWNLGRRIAFIVALGWIPLVLFSAVLQPQSLVSLLTDYRVASRLLLAVPILIIGQVLMESRFRMIVGQVRELFLLPQDTHPLDETLATCARLRDSAIPELIILALVYLRIVLSFSGQIEFATPWAVQGDGSSLNPSVAGWYYSLVSQAIYQFLLGLSLWKWLLWTYFLFKVSRMKLQLAVSHPDQHAGLGFITMSAQAFTPIAFAVAASIGSTWRYKILYAGSHITAYKFPAAALFLITLVIALGPLLIFFPKLAALRRRGILQYGGLAHLQSSQFHDKWILHLEGREPDILAAPEVSTLTDLAASFQNIENIKPLLFDEGSVMGLAIAIAIPLLPAIMAEIPLKVILNELLSAVK